MTDSQKWLALVLVGALGWLLYLLTPILTPFAMAATLAYLGDPLVDRLESMRIDSWRMGRSTAVTVVFSGIILVISALLIVVVPSIEYQIGYFVEQLPSYVAWVNETLIPILRRHLGREIRPIRSEQLMSLIKTNWQNAGGFAEWAISSVSHSGVIILGWLMTLVLTPVITFYLLRDWDDLVVKVHDLLPRRMAPTAAKLAAESDTVLGAFLRGQFYVMLALGCIYSIGLWLVGLDVALLIGMTAGMVSFVPYMGAAIGILTAGIAALLQFQDVWYLLPVALVFGIGQAAEGMVLTPWLVGDKIGLHPVAVMFAVLAGGQLFGFVGVLLALPVASVIMVMLRHVHDRYTGSRFYIQ